MLFGRELSHRQLQRQAQGLAGCSGWPAHSQSGAGKVLWRVLQKRENVQRES